ncbi:T9SS type A sorting domain-containing protein, partial [bacterium]|nr:T9SS type A sorting domain-containing protein [bacterium]
GTTKVAAVFELGNCQNPPYNVTFFLPASSLAGLNGNLAVVHNSNFINPLTITYDSDGDAKIDFVASSCSPFYVQGTSDQPLSVELTSFEAFANENSVNLIWKTASEKNSKGFELERNEKIIASYRTHSELVSAGESSGEKVYTFVDDEVEPNTNYTYGLFEIDQNSTKTFLKDLKIKTKNSILPTEVRYNLKQNFPNPFNPTTTIEFDLKEKSLVTLSVYNSKGELVQTLVNQELEAGNNFKAVWNGTNFSGKQVASGIYFYELRTENFSKTKKMILLK